ncbi:MAG: bifunctional phosphoglucose/phosphomannose isomerase [bacterium]
MAEGFDLSVDSSGMKGLVESWPDQFERSFAVGFRSGKTSPAQPPRVLLWAGMGGSAIGGDFVASMLAPSASFPVIVHRGGHLPAWVGRKDRAILVSYSGNTAETLAAAEALSARGTALDLLTSGGKLKDWGETHGIAVWSISGGHPPRSALGDLFGYTLGVLAGREWTEITESSVQETVQRLRDLTKTLGVPPTDPDHPLHSILEMCEGRLPMIYGTGKLVAAAHRWATQINENAKLPAHWGELPEMNHNEVVAYTEGTPWAEHAAILVLTDPESPKDVRNRVGVTLSIARDAGYPAEEVILPDSASSALSTLLTAAVVGDWVSLWMALGHGVDPTPIAPIDRLKAALEK